MPQEPNVSPEAHRDHVLALLSNSPGSHVAAELGAVGLSARTFDANAFLLTRVLKTFENAFPNELVTPGRRQDLWEFALEVVRLFQNAIASGQSFLEHSKRSVTTRYARAAFRHEFEQHRIANVKSVPVCAFARNLRNYLLHTESITPTLTRSAIDFSDPFDAMVSIRLSTDGMRAETGRWEKDPVARQYLNGLSHSINIRRLIYEYHGAVAVYGDWLLKREREMNAQALNEHDAIVDEAKTLVPRPHDEDLETFRQRWKRDSWFSPSGGHR
jgi:hypothetical protein